jgi:hypothetical protein
MTGRPRLVHRLHMTKHRSRMPYAWALGLLWAVPTVIFSARLLTAPDHNASGQCEGIGFGCALTPYDGTVFLAVLSAPVLFLAGALACLTIWLVRRRADRRNSNQAGLRP